MQSLNSKMPDCSSDLEQRTISFSQKQLWYKLLKNGELNKVIEHVEPYLTAGEQEEVSLALITGLVNLLQNKSNNEVNYEAIHTLFCLCCKSLKINELTKLKYGFLVSSHHVLKYFMNKGHIEEALSVSSYILETKRGDLDGTVMNVYYSNFYHLHLFAVAKIKEFNERHTELLCVLDIMNHALRHLRYCGTKHLCMLLEKAKTLPLKLSEKREKLCLTEFQLNTLELSLNSGAESVLNINTDDLIVSYMSLLTTIVKDCITLKRFGDVQFAVNKAVIAVRSWLPHDPLIKECTGFLQSMLNTLISQSCDYKEVYKNLKSFKFLFSKFKKSKSFYSVCVVISQTISHMFWISKSTGDDDLCPELDAISQKALYELILYLSEIFSKCETVECRCKSGSGEICTVKTDTASSFQLKSTILHMMMTSVINKVDSLESLLPFAENVFQRAAIGIDVLKEQNCAKWIELWKLIGTKGIQLASYCFVAQMYLETKEILKKLLFITFQFGNEAVSALEENGNLFSRGLEYLMDTYRKLERPRGALRIAAIAFMVLPPDSRKYIFKNWVKIKGACSDNLKKCTIYDIYTEDEEQIKLICQGYNIDMVDMAELLVLELEAYNNLGAANLDCVKAAYTVLLTLPSVSWLQKARALLAYCPLVWKHNTLKECKAIISSLKEVLEALSSKLNEFPIADGQMLCIIGHLYFSKFCCSMKAARLKQQQDISQCNSDLTITEEERGEMPDPNDKCDVTPTYLQLNIENELNLLKHLKCAIKNWSEALVKGYKKDDRYQPLKNLEIASYLFNLYGYGTDVITTWLLYYKFSQILGDSRATLTGLYHLLEYCNCKTSKCNLLTEAKAIVLDMKLEEKDDTDSMLLYFNFHLACAQHCFTSEHYTMLPTYLEILNNAVISKKIKTMGGAILNTRITFLITKCKLVSDPSINWSGKTMLPAVKEAKEAYLCCSYLLDQSFAALAEYLHAQCLMIEISLWMGQLFREMVWPRESRCFMRKNLLISQSLSLATRTAQFLDLLAQVDIMCSQVDDGVVKLQGLQLILQLENELQQVSSSMETYIDTELAARLEQLTMEKSQMSAFQGTPKMRIREIDNMSSPKLCNATFTMPAFVYHSDDCRCAICSTLVLQNLVLDTVYLQAQIYSIQSEATEAVKFFMGGIHMKEILNQKQTKWISRFHSELQSISPDNGCANLKPHHNLLPGYIWLAVAYADLLAASGSYRLAQEVNETALQELENLKSKHPHLMRHVLHQQICITQAAKITASPKKSPDELLPCVILLNDIPIDKTPVSSQYRSFNLQKSTYSVAPKKEFLETPLRNKPRKLVLPGSDDEEEKKENTKARKKKQGTKENGVQKKKLGSKENSQIKVKIWRDTEDDPVPRRPVRTRRLLSESQANVADVSSLKPRPTTRSKSTAKLLR